MRKTILKSAILLVAAVLLSVTARAVERNTSFIGVETSIQTDVNYYMFNLGMNLYFGVDYDWTAQAAVIKNPFQQVKLHTASESGFYNIESVVGLQVGKFVFKDGVEVWADQGKEGDMPRRDTYWSILPKGNGVYQLKNRSTIEDTYFGPVSTSNRRIRTEYTVDNDHSKWVFLPAVGADIELFHAKEAILFQKLNEVEGIAGFPTNLITSAIAVYANPAATLSQINAALAELVAAQYSFSSATAENPLDCTNLIENPTIAHSTSNNGARPFGWENSTNSDGPNNFFVKNPEQNTVLEAWGYDYSDVSKFDYNQTLQGMPNGIYRLTTSCFTEANENGESPNGNAGLYAQSGGNDFYKGASSLGTHTITVDLIEVTDNTLKIGVRKNGSQNFRYFTADDFTLTYYGQAIPIYSVDKSDLALSEQANTTVLNISAMNLTSDITISTDAANVSCSPSVVSAADANAGSVAITVTFESTSAGATSAFGSITLTNAEAGNKTIEVITSKEENYQPKANAGNMISDPTVSDLSKFGGWGPIAIVSIKDEAGAPKSGAYCGKIPESGAGSLDAHLVNVLDANTEYVMSAWVKTNGTFNLAVTGSTADATNDVGYVVPDTHGNWEAVEFSFQTGNNPTGKIAYFNNWGFTGTIGYIDNWELYKKSDIPLSIEKTELNHSLKIVTVAGGIKIDSDRNQLIEIFTISGIKFKQTLIESGESTIELPKGIYVVNGEKVIIL